MNPSSSFPVVELRQYTLHPGRRGELVELFEREFIDPQRALGIGLVGPFVDLDDPDRFVWWRGFADMPARAEALQAFYGGPVWAAWRDAANATMRDSDDVLLLRPLDAAGPPMAVSAGGALLVTICPLPDGDADAAGLLAAARAAAAADATVGATPAGWHATEPATNNFPRLPVREGDRVLLWCTALADRNACATLAEYRRAHPAWQALLDRLGAPPQVLRLAPTPRACLNF